MLHQRTRRSQAQGRSSPFRGYFRCFIISSLVALTLDHGLASGTSLEFENNSAVADMAFGHEAVFVEFSYRNKGQDGRRLVSVSSGCGGCLFFDGELPAKTISPGKDGVIVIRVEPRIIRANQVRSVWAEFCDGSRHELSVDIRISEAVTLEGGPLRWQTEDAPYEEQLLELHSHDGSDLIVTDVRVSQPGFSWEVDQPVPLRHYRIRLVPDPDAKPSLAIVQIHTDHEDSRHRIKAAFAEIRGDSGSSDTDRRKDR